MKRWPTPGKFMAADIAEIKEVIRSLGFANRRAINLLKMTERYLTAPWQHASELPGIGEYGARSWEIFCRGILGDIPPKDHALVNYWNWAKERNEQRK